MLIDIKRKTVFIAGLKTASTSIEHVLAPVVDIRLTRSEWGKHDSVAQVQAKFAWIFEREPWNTFFKWAVIREPLDMMRSLYRSHKREDFAQHPRLYTGDMDFGTFLSEWTHRNADQCRPQVERFMDKDGHYGLDLVLPYHSLDKALSLIAPHYELQRIELPWKNVSEAEQAQKPSGWTPFGKPETTDQDAEMREIYEPYRAEIEQRYAKDVSLLRATETHLNVLLGNAQS